ncbi:MAG: AlpA family transcriptional regulator [Alphaproteobacteria bacterium]|nr:AlpA family transcriptional regulator [Alphaproteobacteria bacterium]
MSNKNKILRLPNVIELTGLPRSTIYAYIEQRRFPAPIKISLRSVGWLESEINEWIESCVRASQSGQHKTGGNHE